MNLLLLDLDLAVCRLPAGSSVPDWACSGDFCSVTRTPEEVSLVCRADHVPAGVQSETGWQALKVQGPLNFELTGVLASLAGPLAAAGIPIFVLSTFDTDYLLIKQTQIPQAVGVLTAAGHRIENYA